MSERQHSCGMHAPPAKVTALQMATNKPAGGQAQAQQQPARPLPPPHHLMMGSVSSGKSGCSSVSSALGRALCRPPMRATAASYASSSLQADTAARDGWMSVQGGEAPSACGPHTPPHSQACMTRSGSARGHTRRACRATWWALLLRAPAWPCALAAAGAPPGACEGGRQGQRAVCFACAACNSRTASQSAVHCPAAAMCARGSGRAWQCRPEEAAAQPPPPTNRRRPRTT